MHEVNRRPLALIILDGWGISGSSDRNAVAAAHTPNYDQLCRNFPTTTLASAGERVGLSAGEPGTPESGHLNLGSGRRLRTDKKRIDDAVGSGEFFENNLLVETMRKTALRGGLVHLAGLLSDGDVHSSMEHLFELLRLAKRLEIPKVFVHCFLDGHDVPAKTADIYVEALEVKMDEIGIGEIATLCGRNFAMDDRSNWELTARAYTMLVHSEGEGVTDPKKAIRDAFVRGYSDEFINPIVVENRSGEPLGPVRNGDSLIFFNHRGDGISQIADSLAARGDDQSSFTKPKINIVCLTDYGRDLALPSAFSPEPVRNSLAEVLAKREISIMAVSEGERSLQMNAYLGQSLRADLVHQLSIPSIESAKRSASPENRSFKLADHFLDAFNAHRPGFSVLNLPAAALMAESGNFETTIEAIQFVDTCLGGVVEGVQDRNGIALITSSHAGCERMKKKARDAFSFRASSNPVPFHLIDEDRRGLKLRSGGSLEDVAPTILGILGIAKPSEMTGSDLRVG